MYPAKALIQDQLQKWREILTPLGFHLGFIDGSVPTADRAAIIQQNQVILMTPDTVHAWLLAHASESVPTQFLQAMSLLVLDELHVYDGVFGTNMAYLLRRLQAVSRRFGVICSTATIGDADEFIHQLIGKRVEFLGAECDRSFMPGKEILVARIDGQQRFDGIIRLLGSLGARKSGRFLAFADSRRMVEQVVAALFRKPRTGERAADHDSDDDDGVHDGRKVEFPFDDARILPYRSGYEAADRSAIQSALNGGQLAGVVSTSALELGIDIGDVDVVVMLNVPGSAKAFRQRLGRAGRQRNGLCIIIDDEKAIPESEEGLRRWVGRSPEPNWIYLDNRYVQYSNALCATLELAGTGLTPELKAGPFSTLPESFTLMLQNEIDPRELVPNDLYPLKQQAQAGPHLQFPLRSGVDKQFQVQDVAGQPLGTLSYSQVLREAYPGAIYHYMARPYRVVGFRYAKGQIVVSPERRWSTRPLTQTMVFPRFTVGAMYGRQSKDGFVLETEMQVSERVLGFSEQRGGQRQQHKYEPGSPYWQRHVIRFVETTGVCWCCSEKLAMSEGVANAILDRYCRMLSVQKQDVGVGIFHAEASPLGPGKIQGGCIYDATQGSLRLTHRLAERFEEIVQAALDDWTEDDGFDLKDGLRAIWDVVTNSTPIALTGERDAGSNGQSDWVQVVAPGQKAMRLGGGQPKEVEVIGHRYTPKGLIYELRPNHAEQKLIALAEAIVPIHGTTKLLWLNLITGETKDGI